MILFVSGRCDIPAFYNTWFFNRLREGYVDVRNPYNEHQVSRILLNKENIDCIVFCTKDPTFMLDRLQEIPFPFLFHVTLTGYHRDIEAGVRDKHEIIRAIQLLSQQIGKERVIVRYDPILLTRRYTPNYHERAFASICQQLQGYVDTYIISFVDFYKNTRKNAVKMGIQPMNIPAMKITAQKIGTVAAKYHVQVQTCAEADYFSDYGIAKGTCFDREDLDQRLGIDLRISGRGVRSQCSCLPTVDIGDYNACAHYCAYCYANYDEQKIKENMSRHDPDSSVLLGHIEKEDKITIRREQVRSQ